MRAITHAKVISAPVFCRRFIGRSDELKVVAGVCRQAREGQGAIVLVGGEAGIGKTRFLGEVRASLESGTRALEVQCFENVQSPLGPFVEILHELGAGTIETSGDRLAQFVAIADALRKAGEKQPLFIAIEDVHWADHGTLTCLQYLATKLATAKIVLFITFRTDELHRTHVLTPVIGKLERAKNAQRIDLPSLTESEMSDFVDSALKGHKELDDDTIRDVVTVAEGSPLFIEELLKHALESRNGSRQGLPLSVRAAVLDRCSALDDEERAILTQAAVFGRYFETAFLADLTGHTRERVIATLRKARDLQLIVEEPGNDLEFSFRHALVREALHSELLTAEVRPLHVRIAEHLETLPASDERVQQLAYHWWAARMTEKATAANERAGDSAIARLAYEDAARLYERAIEFVHDGSREQAVLYEKLANALWLAGHRDRSRRAYEQALQHYRFVNDWQKTLETMRYISNIHWVLADAESATRWRRDALDVARERSDDPWYFALVCSMGATHALAGRLEPTLEYLREAEAYRGERQPAHQMSFYIVKSFAEAIRGDFEGFKENAKRAIECAEETGLLEHQVTPWSNIGYLGTGFGRFEDARDGFETAIARARKAKLLFLEAYALSGLSMLQFVGGEYEAARTSIERAFEEEHEPPAIQQIQVASVAIPLGLRTENAEYVERFARDELIDLAFKSGEGQRVAAIVGAFAELYYQQGKEEKARALLRRGEDFIGAIRPWTIVQFALYGAPDGLPRIREQLAPWASYPGNSCGEAFIALLDAFIARNAGKDPTRDAEHALELLSHIGFPYEQAVALELLGRREEALEIYDRIGDARDAKRLRAAVQGINRRGRIRNELTEREREIAQLVATGKSNRAIGEALVISERTVENHLASIFSKLGVASRTELAGKILSASTAAAGSDR